MEATIRKLTEVADKVTKRYESVLKRSREAVGHTLLKSGYDQQDYYGLKSLDGRYEIARAQLLEKNIHEKSHIEMLQAVYECLKKRDILLRDYGLRELQQQLVDIRREMQEISKATEKALEHAEKFKKELAKLTLEHNDNIWNLMQNLAGNGPPAAIQKEASLSNGIGGGLLPDIDSIMGKSTSSPMVNGDLSMNGEGPVQFHVGGSVRTLQNSLGEGSIVTNSMLCFGEGPDVESLINANQSLIMTTEDLISDGFEMLLK